MLLDGLSVLENVCVPKVIKKEPYKIMGEESKKIAEAFWHSWN